MHFPKRIIMRKAVEFMKLDVMSYCNQELKCFCGKTHFCPIEAVIIGSGALRRLPELLRPYSRRFHTDPPASI